MCVITGWDRKCMASLEWIQRMGVDRLDRKDQQPFYNVLVNDGSNRYAAQGQGNFMVDTFFFSWFCFSFWKGVQNLLIQ